VSRALVICSLPRPLPGDGFPEQVVRAGSKPPAWSEACGAGAQEAPPGTSGLRGQDLCR
jgi:hypothetical protein